MISDYFPILTAAQMRAAEDRAIAAGSSVTELMERAGAGVAQWVRRVGCGSRVLMLCGPGNNGGDGYVAARILAQNGMRVQVVALGEPRTEAAAQARARWAGPVDPFPLGELAFDVHAPIVVDALFGTGLDRPLYHGVRYGLDMMTQAAQLPIAVDVPSFVNSDTGSDFRQVVGIEFGLTLALGALKPAHVLQPAAAYCGEVRVIDIGLGLDEIPAPRDNVSAVYTVEKPRIMEPEPWSHKYNRGMVAVVSGPMHGASELAALAAYRAGAGYVMLLAGGLPHPPHAIVRRRWSGDALEDERIGAVVIGPGLGRDERARSKLDVALSSGRPLVIDGDALHLLDVSRLREREALTILTPHAGEFAALFGGSNDESKIVRAQRAAQESNAVVVFKGADTVVAGPDGLADVLTGASPWLSVAGTGDVLAGAIGAMLARRPWNPYGAASAGVWLHSCAAQILNGCFLADELADALPTALARAR